MHREDRGIRRAETHRKGAPGAERMEQPLLLEPAKKKPAPKPVAQRIPGKAWIASCSRRLRLLRRELAKQRSVPAYIVFTDATLRDLARKRPLTPDTLLRVSGIGAKKLEQYGEALLAEICRYCG